MFPVPVGLGVVEAALAEPVAVAGPCGAHLADQGWRSVVILGAGPIGLGVLQSAVAAGAMLTIVSEPSEARRAGRAVRRHGSFGSAYRRRDRGGP